MTEKPEDTRYVANVSYMLHDSVGDYSFIVDIIFLVRSVRWQTSCHGET